MLVAGVSFGMHQRSNQRVDEALPISGYCILCGRAYNINEVNVGIYVDYYVKKGQECSCPTCFSEQIHRMQDPSLQDVLARHRYCDRKPSTLLQQASVWAPHPYKA